MKEFGYTASIINGNNFATSHSDSDWRQIRPNSSIRFENDDNFYTVIKSEEVFYIKDFTVQNSNELIVLDNVTVNLLEGDTLTISYKEFELQNIDIINSGKGYKRGEMLSVTGGISPINPIDGIQHISTFSIDEIGSAGDILKISIKNRGKYSVQPKEDSKVNGGSGAGLKLKLNYNLCSDRSNCEREVVNITHNSNNSVVKILYPLPEGILDGKLSVNKWKVFLSSPYVGANKLSVNYEIIRDVTPNIGLPLIADGSLANEKLINRAFSILDSKIKELENKINKVK